jgi:hypothetical protein
VSICAGRWLRKLTETPNCLVFIYVALPLMLVVVFGPVLGEDPLTVFLTYTEAVFGAGT